MTQETARVEQHIRGTSSVTYTITGSRASVQSAIDDIFAEYHPCGYSTTIKSEKKLEGDQLEIIVWRAHSCD